MCRHQHLRRGIPAAGRADALPRSARFPAGTQTCSLETQTYSHMSSTPSSPCSICSDNWEVRCRVGPFVHFPHFTVKDKKLLGQVYRYVRWETPFSPVVRHFAYGDICRILNHLVIMGEDPICLYGTLFYLLVSGMNFLPPCLSGFLSICLSLVDFFFSVFKVFLHNPPAM